MKGDWYDIVEYDSQSGRFWKVDKDPLGQQVLVDIFGKTIGFDIGSVEEGWMAFGPRGPIRHTVPRNSSPPPMPDDLDKDGRALFKPGYHVKVVGKAIDGGPREWASTTIAVVDAFDRLDHGRIEPGRRRHGPGQSGHPDLAGLQDHNRTRHRRE